MDYNFKVLSVTIQPGNIKITASDSLHICTIQDCSGCIVAINIEKDDGTKTLIPLYGTVAFIEYE